MFIALLMAAAGVLIATAFSLVPALHVYNVVELILLGTAALGYPLPSHHLAPLLVGMVTGYAALY